MSGFLQSIGWGLLGLLSLAALTAWYEYLRDQARPRRGARPAAPPARRAASVDLDLDRLPPAASADQPRRRAALAQLGRAPASAAGAAGAAGWPETEPMVAPGNGVPQTEQG